MSATITSKGQITIPIQVRRALGLRPGMRVSFVPTDNGTYEIVPETGSIRSVKGAVPRPPQPVSLEDMDAAVAEGAAESTR